MKTRKLFLALLMLLISAIAITAVACKPNPPTPGPVGNEGPETGAYYCTSGSDEYVLILNNVNKFTFVAKSEAKSGTYKITDGNIAFTFDSRYEGEAISGAKYDSVNITLVYDNLPLKFWRDIKYTVTFDNEGASQTKTVRNGSSVSAPADPEREGYIFLGWFKEDGTPFGFDAEPVTGNLTLNAKWEEAQSSATGVGYTVKFDLGYEGAENPEAQKTEGGFIKEPAVPSRSGYKFGGWWVSHYEDGERLAHKFDASMEIKQNQTLYAVWTPDNTNAMLAEVKNDAIVWNGISSVSSYNIDIEWITDEGNRSIHSQKNFTETRLEFNWDEQRAGNYIITISGGTYSETRYYSNKTLSRVSQFSVSGTTLKFNKVDNAERYYLTIECGNEDHNHDFLDNGPSTTYNFANCPMKDGKITFKVTAVGTGYAQSVSQEYVCEKLLPSIESLDVDEENEIVSWNEVENAAGYKVEMKCGNASHKHIYNGVDTKISYKECNSGNIVVNVTPIAKGYGSPAYTKAEISKETPSTPTGIKVVGSKVSWNRVEGASYRISFGNVTRKVETEEFDLSTELQLATGVETVVSVVSVKNGKESLPSDGVKIIYNSLDETLRYMGSTLYWTHVGGSAYYSISVNGERIPEQAIGENHQKVTLTKAGKNVLSISYFDEYGVQSAEATLEVIANRVILNGEGGSVDTVLYKVAGDDMSDLPVPEKAGYTFGGWYNVPGGADSNGAKYEDTIFAGGGDIELYADWRPIEYKIKFMVGDSEIAEPLPQDIQVKFGKEFTLPVPQNSDKRMMFVAWTFENDDLTSRICDGSGASTRVWNIDDVDEDGYVKLYPSWAQVFRFALDADKSSYTVSQEASGIQKVKTVTVPAMYTDPDTGITAPVRTVGSFANAPITTINIPNTVQSIYTNSGGFEGCNSLTDINIYEPTDKNPALYKGPYVSYEGNLVKINDTTTGMSQGKAQLVYVPRGIRGRYSIPVGVDAIGYRAAMGSEFTELVIPSGVEYIEGGAFSNCANIRTIVFEEKASGKDLLVSGDAFSGCSSLRDLYLPSRFKVSEGNTFSEIFENCNKLKSVSISNNHTDYTADKGVIYSKNKENLIYCPSGVSGDYVIAAGTRSIAEKAFYGIKGLTSVSFANVIENVGASAFEGCTALRSVTFSRNLIAIGDKAFFGCRNLNKLDFSASTNLKTIGEYAFAPGNSVVYSNKQLRGVKLPETVTSIGKYAFYQCYNAISDLILPVCDSIGENAFFDCMGIERVVLNSVRTIGVNAFAMASLISDYGEVSAMKEVNLGDKLVSIGNSAFEKCINIKRIFVPATLDSVGAQAFSGCSSVYEICNKSKIALGVNAFYTHGSEDESWIETVDEKFVFYKNPSQANAILMEYIGKESTVVLPDYYKDDIGYSIRSKSFFNNIGITKITIGRGVNSIEGGAFAGCTMLYEVYNLSNVNITTGSGYFPNLRYVYNSADEASKFDTINGFIFSASDAKVELVGYAGNEATVVLPDYYGENRDYTISANTFTGKTVENLTIGKGVKVIPDKLFKNNTTLRTVTINGDGTSIGSEAFASCKALTTVNLSGVAAIGNKTFFKCALLESITLPDSLTSMGEYAFGMSDLLGSEGSSALKEVKLGAGLTSLPTGAFFNCKSLESLVIPSNIKVVNSFAFSKCRSLEKVEVEEGVETFGKSVFENCSNLYDVSLPASLTSLGASTFAYCVSLPDIVDTPGFSAINEAMYNACSFSDVVIPSNITEIGKSAFLGCDNLRSVVIGENVQTVIFENAFSNCLKMQVVYNLSGLDIDEQTIILSKNTNTGVNIYAPIIFETLEDKAVFNTTEENFVFMEADGRNFLIDYKGKDAFLILPYDYKGGAYEIAQCAFNENTTISSVTLSKNITKIGTNAFAAKYGKTNIKNIDIPNGIIEIGMQAFYNQGLTSLRIPDSVQVIDRSAFSNNKNLVTLTLGSNVREIRSYAFQANSSLKKVVIPDSVETIGERSFFGCSVMESIVLGRGLKDIQSEAFGSCGNLKTVVNYSNLPIVKGSNSYGQVAAHADVVIEGEGTLDMVNGFSLTRNSDGTATLIEYTGTSTDIVFPEYELPYEIPNNFFARNYNIRSVTISDSVTAIGNNAFNTCNNLERVVIGNNVTRIGTYAFADCKLLSSLTIGTKVNSIGANAFQKTALTRLVIPGNVQSIGQSAFDDNKSLKSVIIEDGVKTIGNYCFGGTTSLEWIVLGSGITSIGKYALNESTKLGGYYVHCSEAEWEAKGINNNDVGANGTFTANVPFYYFSEEPAVGCWHYGEDNVPVLWTESDVQ